MKDYAVGEDTWSRDCKSRLCTQPSANLNEHNRRRLLTSLYRSLVSLWPPTLFASWHAMSSPLAPAVASSRLRCILGTFSSWSLVGGTSAVGGPAASTPRLPSSRLGWSAGKNWGNHARPPRKVNDIGAAQVGAPRSAILTERENVDGESKSRKRLPFSNVVGSWVRFLPGLDVLKAIADVAIDRAATWSSS
jgi:hypothetical protein